MAATMTLLGDEYAFGLLVNARSSLGNPHLHLFNNNYSPADTDTSPSVFTEPTDPGYSVMTINPGSWIVTNTGGSGSVWVYPTVTWLFSAGDTIYGYYVTDPTDGVVLWAEDFAGGPVTIPSIGGAFQLSVQVQAHTCP